MESLRIVLTSIPDNRLPGGMSGMRTDNQPGNPGSSRNLPSCRFSWGLSVYSPSTCSFPSSVSTRFRPTLSEILIYQHAPFAPYGTRRDPGPHICATVTNWYSRAGPRGLQSRALEGQDTGKTIGFVPGRSTSGIGELSAEPTCLECFDGHANRV